MPIEVQKNLDAQSEKLAKQYEELNQLNAQELTIALNTQTPDPGENSEKTLPKAEKTEQEEEQSKEAENAAKPLEELMNTPGFEEKAEQTFKEDTKVLEATQNDLDPAEILKRIKQNESARSQYIQAPFNLLTSEGTNVGAYLTWSNQDVAANEKFLWGLGVNTEFNKELLNLHNWGKLYVYGKADTNISVLSKEGTKLIEDKKTGTTEEKTFTEVQPKFGVSTITRIDRKTPWKVGDLDFGTCLEIQANTGERTAASYWVYVSNDPNEKFRYMIGVGGSLFGREGSAREGVREGGTALAAIPTNDIFFTSVYKPTNKMMITGGLDVKNTWPALISQEDLIKNMQKLQVMANLGLKYQVTKSVQASLEGNIGRKDNQLKGAVRAWVQVNIAR